MITDENKCARCGAKEFRIDGYCSVYCEDMHELEQMIQTLRKQKAALIEDAERLADYVSLTLHKQGRADTFPKGDGGLIEKHESLMREVKDEHK